MAREKNNYKRRYWEGFLLQRYIDDDYEAKSTNLFSFFCTESHLLCSTRDLIDLLVFDLNSHCIWIVDQPKSLRRPT